MVITIAIDSASAKVATGMPDDETEDYDIPIWAGVLPISTKSGDIQSDDRLLPEATASSVVLGLQRKTL